MGVVKVAADEEHARKHESKQHEYVGDRGAAPEPPPAHHPDHQRRRELEQHKGKGSARAMDHTGGQEDRRKAEPIDRVSLAAAPNEEDDRVANEGRAVP